MKYIKQNYKFIVVLISIVLLLSIRFPYYIDAPGGITDMNEKIERLGTVPPVAVVGGMDLINHGFKDKSLYSTEASLTSLNSFAESAGMKVILEEMSD